MDVFKLAGYFLLTFLLSAVFLALGNLLFALVSLLVPFIDAFYFFLNLIGYTPYVLSIFLFSWFLYVLLALALFFFRLFK